MKITQVGTLQLNESGQLDLRDFRFDTEGVGYPEDGNGNLDMTGVRFQRDMAMALLQSIVSGQLTPPGFIKAEVAQSVMTAATKRTSRAPRATRRGK